MSRRAHSHHHNSCATLFNPITQRSQPPPRSPPSTPAQLAPVSPQSLASSWPHLHRGNRLTSISDSSDPPMEIFEADDSKSAGIEVLG